MAVGSYRQVALIVEQLLDRAERPATGQAVRRRGMAAPTRLRVPIRKFDGGNRLANEVALRDVAFQRRYAIPDFPAFHALCDNFELEVVREFYGRADYGFRLLVGGDPGDERLIDLDRVDRQFLQIAE